MRQGRQAWAGSEGKACSACSAGAAQRMPAGCGAALALYRCPRKPAPLVTHHHQPGAPIDAVGARQRRLVQAARQLTKAGHACAGGRAAAAGAAAAAADSGVIIGRRRQHLAHVPPDAAVVVPQLSRLLLGLLL